MDLESLKLDMEKPIYSSLDEVYKKAELNDSEIEVFNRNRKYCEYWLLRSKNQYHQSFNNDTPNFIKRLAAVINHLESPLVSGQKYKKLKELFAVGKSIHTVQETSNGYRTKQHPQYLKIHILNCLFYHFLLNMDLI